MNAIELAETIKADVLKLVADGVIPATVGSFGVLHDYCDANCLGSSEELFDAIVTESATDDEHSEKLDAVNAILNPAQIAVDAWIKKGGVLNALPAILADKDSNVFVRL